MAQAPSYPEMVVAPHLPISINLQNKYGHEVAWPVFWYNPNDVQAGLECVHFSTFEINAKNTTNFGLTAQSRLLGHFSAQHSCFKLDYRSSVRAPEVLHGKQPIPADVHTVAKQPNQCSYDYINSVANTRYATIDIDYLAP